MIEKAMGDAPVQMCGIKVGPKFFVSGYKIRLDVNF